MVKCILKRPLLNKDLTKDGEFLVEYKQGDKAQIKQVPFTINPNSISNTSSVSFSLKIDYENSCCCQKTILNVVPSAHSVV